MATDLETLRWARGVRFLHGGDQTIATSLPNRSFVKIRTEAFALVQEALSRGLATVLERLGEEDRAGLSSLLRTLEERRYLVHGDDRPDELDPRSALARYVSAPKIAYYALSDSCNLACAFCYADAGRRSATYHGDTGRSLAAVDQLAALNVVNLILSGGEPLLREDLFEIAEHAKAKGLLVGVTTNGTLIGPREAARMKGAGVDYVQVSVESPDEAEHDALRGRGSHRASVEALRLLKAQGYERDQLYVTATTMRKNLVGLQRYGDFADGLGVTPGASFFQPVGRGQRSGAALGCSDRELLGYVVSRMNEKKAAVAGACADVPRGQVSDALVPRVINCCGMGEKTIGVKEDGTVVPCHLFFSTPGAGVGNILDEDIAERLCAFASALPTVDDVEECRDCDVRYFCGNGCWAHVHAAHGELRRRNPYCGFYKKYYSAVVWNLGLEDAMARIHEELTRA